jgi:hypothetical protein
MNPQSRATRASPKLIGAAVLVGAIFLAYQLGQWMLNGGVRGLGQHIGMLVGGAVAAAVLVRWRTGILVFLFWLTFEDLFRKYAGNDMYIYFVKDALLAVVYVSFFVGVARGREKVFRPKFWVPLMALFFLALAQVFNPMSTSIFYGLLGMKIDFYYVPLIFLGYSLLRSQEDLDRFISFSLKMALFVALVGIIQGLGWGTFLNPASLAPQLRALGHLYRWTPGTTYTLSAPPSIFVSQGRYGNYLSLMTTLALGFCAFAIFRRRPAKLAFLTLGILGIAIFLSGSKGSFVYALLTLVGLAVGLVWGAGNQPWISARLGKILRRSLVAMAASLLLFVYLYPKLASAWGQYYYVMLWPSASSSQLGFRTGAYPLNELRKVLEYSGWEWGFGTGTASLGVQYVTELLKAPPPPVYAVENGFGDMILEWGILGPILWLALALTLVIAGWKVCRRLASTPIYPVALSILWFAFWVLLPFMWSGLDVYQNYIVNAYLWTLVGVLFRLPELAIPAVPQRFAERMEAARPAEPVHIG